jgi:hypothetical protein
VCVRVCVCVCVCDAMATAAPLAPTVHTSRALRHQQAASASAAEAIKAAMAAAEQARWPAAVAEARRAVAEAERGLALRASYTPTEWCGALTLAHTQRQKQGHTYTRTHTCAMQSLSHCFSPGGLGRWPGRCTSDWSAMWRHSVLPCATLKRAVRRESERR